MRMLRQLGGETWAQCWGIVPDKDADRVTIKDQALPSELDLRNFRNISQIEKDMAPSLSLPAHVNVAGSGCFV